ncbi:MAG: ABC transporter permease [Lachnospiraceae bacterium]|nr:ABC transporter permease [Lachnospiraceae bacterium]
MLIFENILLALNGLRANKTRSLLTMLGIIIGIASVITIMTVGESMTASLTSEMSSMGATNVTIGVSMKESAYMTDESGRSFNSGPHRTEMTDDDYIDADMLKSLQTYFGDKIENIQKTASVGSGTVQYGGKTSAVNVSGVNNDTLEAAELTMKAGKLFTDRDQESAKKIAIVSDYMLNEVYGADVNDVEEYLGKQISVVMNNKFYHYTIVGIYEYDESNETYSFESTTSTSLYIPLITGFNELHTRERYNEVTVATVAGINLDDFMVEIEDYLNEVYYRNNDNFEVNCYSLSSMLESMTEMMSTISVAISVIAGISLLVGGIGVMNIMLVSIQERTREIGTRKALGATNSSIRMQFIVESIVLCIVGGVIGIIIGLIAGSIAAQKLAEVDATAPINGIILSVGFSVAIGVFFGYYPANKAAKMNPIDALRYE